MSSSPVEETQPADALAATLKRTETLHRSSSIPGREIVQVRTAELILAGPAVAAAVVRRHYEESCLGVAPRHHEHLAGESVRA